MLANSKAVSSQSLTARATKNFACLGTGKGLQSRTHTAATALLAAPPPRARSGPELESLAAETVRGWSCRARCDGCRVAVGETVCLTAGAERGRRVAVPSNRNCSRALRARRPRTGAMQVACLSSLQFARPRAPLSGYGRSAWPRASTWIMTVTHSLPKGISADKGQPGRFAALPALAPLDCRSPSEGWRTSRCRDPQFATEIGAGDIGTAHRGLPIGSRGSSLPAPGTSTHGSQEQDADRCHAHRGDSGGGPTQWPGRGV